MLFWVGRLVGDQTFRQKPSARRAGEAQCLGETPCGGRATAIRPDRLLFGQDSAKKSTGCLASAHMSRRCLVADGADGSRSRLHSNERSRSLIHRRALCISDDALCFKDALFFEDDGLCRFEDRANPLGAKGCGEAGCVGALPAVANAVIDALLGAGRAPHRHPGDAEAGVAHDPRRAGAGKGIGVLTRVRLESLRVNGSISRLSFSISEVSLHTMDQNGTAQANT